METRLERNASRTNMERGLLVYHQGHRFYNSSSRPCSPSSIAALGPLHSPSPPLIHKPARGHPLLACHFPPQASFGSLFHPLHLVPLCPTHSHLPIACVSSSVFAAGAGGGGVGPGGSAGGGGGGHGFIVSEIGTRAVGSQADDDSCASTVEDFIFLDVGGMSCGGCASSVKKILESQPHVLDATVDLATETAVVKVSSSPELFPGNTKLDVGEALAKHLSSCGFKSSVREDPVGG